MALLSSAGHKIVNSVERAEVVIINTCGFIEEAKEEGINTLLETAELKTGGILKYLVATGCLAQRNGKELFDEMPELDAVIGISYFVAIKDILTDLQNGGRILKIGPPPETFVEKGPRIISTPPGSAYLKIVEGCNNRCSYCAIPSIRGKLRSRPIGELVEEAHILAGQGIKELVLIAQDTANYGYDLQGKSLLPQLLKELQNEVEVDWIRLLYLHPAHISDDIINYPKVNKCDMLLSLTQKACDKYIDSLKPGGVLILDNTVTEHPNRDDIKIYSIPILETAEDTLNKPMVANIIALGSIYQLTKVVSKESLEKAVLSRVPRGTEELNKKALGEGFKLIKNHKDSSYGEVC